MREFVNSLKRLHSAGKIEQGYVELLYKKGKITEEEKEYIVG